MTSGDPQPLTRRQARELARGTAPAALPLDAAPVEIIRATDAPAAKRAVEAAASAPTPAAVPASAGRSLTRREMRAQKAESSAADEVAVAEPVASVPAPVPEAPTPTDRPAGLHPPHGHWSVDPQDDDGHTQTIDSNRSFDPLMGHGIGSGGIPTTTNTLILPSIPQQGATSGPLSNTGEIMITGSFDLPRSLGETGQHPNLFDSSELDHMLEEVDEAPMGDSAPVSASRAVSTHTSTRGVMTPPKRWGAWLPAVLAVTAAVLALGVLALFVAGYLFKVF